MRFRRLDFSKDYYQVLGIDSGATPGQIRAAYRQLARREHPDLSRADDAVQRMQAINEAYEILSDPQTRALYDAVRFPHRRAEGWTDSAWSVSAPRPAPKPPAPSLPGWIDRRLAWLLAVWGIYLRASRATLLTGIAIMAADVGLMALAVNLEESPLRMVLMLMSMNLFPLAVASPFGYLSRLRAIS